MGSVTWISLAATNAIPTLSQMMMILLSLMLFVLAFRYFKPGGGASRLMGFAVLALAAGFMATPIIQVSLAAPAPITVDDQLYSCGGGTASYDIEKEFVSACDVPIRITDIQTCTQAGNILTAERADVCTIGLTLEKGDSCLLQCTIPPA